MHRLLGLMLYGGEFLGVGAGGGDCGVVGLVFVSVVYLLVHHHLCAGEMVLLAGGTLVGPSAEVAAHVYLECCTGGQCSTTHRAGWGWARAGQQMSESVRHQATPATELFMAHVATHWLMALSLTATLPIIPTLFPIFLRAS